MKKNLFIILLLSCGILICNGGKPAYAQSELDRLQQSIRDRTAAAAKPAAKSAADAAKKKSAQSAAQPIPAPPASTESAASADESTGWLGIKFEDQNDRGRGVRVVEVRPNSPAAAAGIKIDDLITSIAGVRIRQMSDMGEVLGLYSPGNTIDIDVLRDNKQQQFKVTLGVHPAPAVPAAPIAGSAPAPAPKTAAKGSQPGGALAKQTPVPPPPELLEEPPVAGPQLVPAAPVERSVKRPTDEQSQMQELLQRINQLESRVQKLEQAQEKTGSK
jgi:hypothetical protein